MITTYGTYNHLRKTTYGTKKHLRDLQKNDLGLIERAHKSLKSCFLSRTEPRSHSCDSVSMLALCDFPRSLFPTFLRGRLPRDE